MKYPHYKRNQKKSCKYSASVLARAKILKGLGNSYSKIAKRMKIPQSTIRYWLDIAHRRKLNSRKRIISLDYWAKSRRRKMRLMGAEVNAYRRWKYKLNK